MSASRSPSTRSSSPSLVSGHQNEQSPGRRVGAPAVSPTQQPNNRCNPFSIDYILSNAAKQQQTQLQDSSLKSQQLDRFKSSQALARHSLADQLNPMFNMSTQPQAFTGQPNGAPMLSQQQQAHTANPNFFYFMACMLIQQQQQQAIARQQQQSRLLAALPQSHSPPEPSPIDSLALLARLTGTSEPSHQRRGAGPQRSSQPLGAAARRQPYPVAPLPAPPPPPHSQVHPLGAHGQPQPSTPTTAGFDLRHLPVGRHLPEAQQQLAARAPKIGQGKQQHSYSSQLKLAPPQSSQLAEQLQAPRAAAAGALGDKLDNLKPAHSYIGLIGMCVLSSPEKRMVLNDIYQYILDHYPYYRNRGSGWRNSVRHNLSLNECFQKAGRAANGKGHYWTIHPANMDDFMNGDFRRRRAQRKVRRWNNMDVPSDESDDESMEDAARPPLPEHFKRSIEMHKRLEAERRLAPLGGGATAGAVASPFALTLDSRQQQASKGEFMARVAAIAAAAQQQSNGLSLDVNLCQVPQVCAPSPSHFDGNQAGDRNL